MAKAVKLPSGNWNVRALEYTDKNGKKHFKSFTAPTKKEAEYLAAEYYLNKKTKSTIGIANMTLSEAMRRYLDSMSNILSPSTICGYDQIYRLRLKSIMHLPLSKLTNEKIQVAINEETTHLKPKTVSNISAFLSVVLKKYYPDFSYNVVLPKKIKYEISIPSQKQMRQVLDDVVEKEMEIPLLLAVCLGLRRSELIGLKWENINFDKGTIRIDTAIVTGLNAKKFEKGPKSTAGYRILSVPESIMQKLKEAKKTAKSEKVVNLTGEAIYGRFDHILKRLELPHFRLHDLRHYFASVLLAMGIPNKYAQQRMGHSTDNMLKNVYQHIMEDTKNEIDKSVDNYFDDFLSEKS